MHAVAVACEGVCRRHLVLHWLSTLLTVFRSCLLLQQPLALPRSSCLLHIWLCRMEELKRQISSLQSMIKTSSAASLPDGGAKLRSRLASLHEELASLDGTGRMPFAHVLAWLLPVHLHFHTPRLHVSAAFMDAQ